MRKLILLLLTLTLVGSTTSSLKAGVYSLQNLDRSLKQVPVDRIVNINVSEIWPLKNQGTYLQKITASANGNKITFAVHLNIEQYRLEMVAFDDMAGRLYKMDWNPKELIWERSQNIPTQIKPENIIADFLLVNLPIDQLKKKMKNGHISEYVIGNDKIRVVKNGRVIRKITYRNPIEAMWGNVIVENPSFGYMVNIQTVVQ